MMKVSLDHGAFCPTRAHAEDAGLDLYSMEDAVVPAGGSATFDTGVHVQVPIGMVGFLKSKSGLNVKHGIVSEGVIDAGYTGSIVVKLYNHSDQSYTVRKGDKISQLVVLSVSLDDIEIVDAVEGSTRGNNGFGSSGRGAV